MVTLGNIHNLWIIKPIGLIFHINKLFILFFFIKNTGKSRGRGISVVNDIS